MNETDGTDEADEANKAGVADVAETNGSPMITGMVGSADDDGSKVPIGANSTDARGGQSA